MSGSVYDTSALVGVVENLLSPPSFLLDTFFSNEVVSDTEYVAIDVFQGKRRLAPFCAPTVAGKLVASRGFTTTEFKAPYVKDVRVLDPRRPIRRAIGEQVGGNVLTPGQRENAVIAMEMEDQIAMLTRRMEWMAASALVSGSISVSGEGYPDPVTINFQRSAAQTLTLLTTARWGESGVSPVDDVDTWAATVLQASGYVVTDIIHTPSTWKYYREDLRAKGVLDSTMIQRGDLPPGGRVPEEGGQYLGQQGGYNHWRYYGWYVDPADDTEKPLIPDNTLLLTTRRLDGVRAYATILDPEFNYQALKFAPKTWVEKDPAVRKILMQAAPLVIPTNVNASMAVTVR